MSYRREEIGMSGPNTDELIRNGMVRTDMVGTISQQHFPVCDSKSRVLLVFFHPPEDEGDLETLYRGMRLSIPTHEHAIRASYQMNANLWKPTKVVRKPRETRVLIPKSEPQEEKETKEEFVRIIFPHGPKDTGISPATPAWLTLVAEPDISSFKLTLFNVRSKFPKNYFLAGLV